MDVLSWNLFHGRSLPATPPIPSSMLNSVTNVFASDAFPVKQWITPRIVAGSHTSRKIETKSSNASRWWKTTGRSCRLA